MNKIDIEKISEGNHKAYSELIETLEKVKDAIKKQNYGIAMDILCKPYPAFQVITLSSESKDEKIRKGIIKYLEQSHFGEEHYSIDDDTVRDYIDWLEQQGGKDEEILILKDQIESLHAAIKAIKETHRIELEKRGEQNLANSAKTRKNEPKFRVGDTIHKIGENTIFPMVIEEIKNGEYVCDNNHSFINIKFQDDYELVEQKPADKVEPKFHEGEWIILTAGELSTTLQIVKVDTNKKLYWFNDSSYLPIVDEECLHLWSIQDAKDGDILCSNQIIVLFKQWEDNTDYSFVIAHAGIDVSGKLQVTNGHWLISNKSKPATKEQRDLLFQKMKEAGYEWDADAKVLKEIEQKSAEWTKEDIQMYRNILSYLSEPSPLKEVNGKSREQLLDWFKGFKDRYTWKPSEEQIKALEAMLTVSPQSPAITSALLELYEQLKKLREE